MLPIYHGKQSRDTVATGDALSYSKLREKRRHERYFMQFPVTFTFDNGTICDGLSHDISLAGFFVNTKQDFSMEEAISGTGKIQLGENQYTFSCRVCRKTRAGFGVSIIKDQAILGYAITTHIFNSIAR